MTGVIRSAAKNFEPLLPGEHLDSIRVSEEEISNARLTVAEHCLDADDLLDLLGMLGLLPKEKRDA